MGDTDTILAMCRDMGFALAGIAPARPTDHGDALSRWMDEFIPHNRLWMPN